MSSITLPSVEPRIKKVDVKRFNVASFDLDNAYAQRIAELVNASPTAKACVDKYARYIGGRGFKDPNLYNLILNKDGLTGDDLLNKLKIDYATFKGLSVLVNYNALYKPVSYYLVPFEHCRLGIDTQEGKIAVHKDWGRRLGRNIEDVKYYDKFDSTPEGIQLQVEKAGGWDNYKGQIYWHSSEIDTYPLSSVDSVLESILAEIASDKTTTSNLKNNFALKYRIKRKPKFENPTERQESADTYKKFIGDSGVQVSLEDGDVDDDFPTYEKLETALNDKLFEYTDKKVVSKIIKSFQQPTILHSTTEGSGMFNEQQLRDAMFFYNGETEPERLLFERIFAKLFNGYESLTAESDYSIIPLNYSDLTNNIKPEYFPYVTRNEVRTSINQPELADTDADKKLLVEVLGVGGTQALTAILIDPILSQDQKVQALIIVFGINSDEAKSLVYGTNNNS